MSDERGVQDHSGGGLSPTHDQMDRKKSITNTNRPNLCSSNGNDLTKITRGTKARGVGGMDADGGTDMEEGGMP
jgi:hypothetical protein